MQTQKIKTRIPISQEDLLSILHKRTNLRFIDEDLWINEHASGTLRKNKRMGAIWKAQYIEERIHFEFGVGFEHLSAARVNFNDVRTESDCKPLTEWGYYLDKYISYSIFQDDIFEGKWIIAEYADGNKKEGAGIIVKQTSAPFIPDGCIVFAIIAEYNAKKRKFKEAINPF